MEFYLPWKVRTVGSFALRGPGRKVSEPQVQTWALETDISGLKSGSVFADAPAVGYSTPLGCSLFKSLCTTFPRP